ncbi:hypothetical protein [Leeuwenhoekiella aequorea]|uniref:hypothetical protein n=1 Tax=Leeuwenhoekiella aequorea TaxID=283736 RepID=UPI00352FE250
MGRGVFKILPFMQIIHALLVRAIRTYLRHPAEFFPVDIKLRSESAHIPKLKGSHIQADMRGVQTIV